MAQALGIDIGGSGIKGALVDTTSGELASGRIRIPTPRPATPGSVAETVRQLVSEHDYSGPVGCCFPTIVVDGHAKSASNMGEEWRDLAVDKTFSEATGLPFTVLNDADAAGMAEMRLGAGVELDGLVITITVGTGIGSALFYRGQLIPNLELGHMAGKGGDIADVRHLVDRRRQPLGGRSRDEALAVGHVVELRLEPGRISDEGVGLAHDVEGAPPRRATARDRRPGLCLPAAGAAVAISDGSMDQRNPGAAADAALWFSPEAYRYCLPGILAAALREAAV